METKTKNSTYPLVMTAVMAAVIAAVSPFAIPIGPISLSLCTLVLYMTPYILGWRRGALATLVFLLVGMVGAPVFTGFQGGMAKVLGPTGIYPAGHPHRSGRAVLPQKPGAPVPGDACRHRCALRPGDRLVLRSVGFLPGQSHAAVRYPLHPRRPDQNGGGDRTGPRPAGAAE